MVKRKKNLEQETNKYLDNIISNLKEAKSQAEARSLEPSVLQSLKDKASKLQECYKETQTTIYKYGKSVEKKFKQDLDLEWVPQALDNKEDVLDAIIAQHFVREGRFELAELFSKESGTPLDASMLNQFGDMFSITEALKNKDVSLAIQWAFKNRSALERIGTSLEFQLHRLEYLNRAQTGGPLAAIQYAKANFDHFGQRHIKGIEFNVEIQKLMCSLLYFKRLSSSPYASLINPHAWADIQVKFCRDFCSLIGIGSDAPLYTSVVVGTLSLPYIHKMAQVMKVQPGLDWSQQGEMAIDLPLLNSHRFHSIFACPVSKEQSTLTNPPMMMLCGHVISKESLMRICKGNMNTRFKCPYCPSDSTASQAVQVYF